jgi:SAM-dependent methyltransferase
LKPGERVLDVGCGPGFAAFDLAQFVQHSGRVVGVDESAPFIAHLEAQAAARGLAHLSGITADVQRLGDALAPQARFDFAYARWVLCFVPRPEAMIAGVSAALELGGRFAIQDYFNYEAMTLAPRRESYAKVVAATARSWRARGGDPDVVARLPRLLREHGLRVEHLEQRQRIARPGESMWHWTDSWWRNYVPKLVAMGEITPDDERRFFADWESLHADTDFAVLPTVFEIVAVRA